MNESILTKWRLLLSNLDVVSPNYYPGRTVSLSTLSSAELSRIEDENDLIFPDEYKAYCQVFGDGIFDSTEFQISPPHPLNFDRYLISKKIELEACQDSYPWSDNCLDLLGNAYALGYGAGDVQFMFDLRTYNNVDRSADIYGVACYGGYIHSFGRDFFAFINDYCIGQKAELDCPQLLEHIPSDSSSSSPQSRRNCFISLPRQNLQF
jgi:hypothetical protein